MRILHAVLPVLTTALASGTLLAQEGGDAELRGTVIVSGSDEVVAGAWIALEGAGWGTYSWNDGHFYLPEVPDGPETYEVDALGFRPALVTLDPAEADLVLELVPNPAMQEGLEAFLEQLEVRRQHAGDLRVFDREDLAFHSHFDLRGLLNQHGVRRFRGVCLNERPEAVGILEREGREFYLVESVGGYVRIYTQEFVEEAARERYRLQRDPRICSGPVGKDAA